MTSILLIAVYLGSLPPWYPAFLASCRGNETIRWLIVTDAVPSHTVPNVRHRCMAGEELESLVSERLGVQLDIRSNPRKLCDLKPAFGHLFAEDAAPFDYWGHCDLDVVWGDLWTALDPRLRAGADVISLRRQRLSGHLTLFRNCPAITRLFACSGEFAKTCATSCVTMFDELAMSTLVAHRARSSELRVSWPSFVLEDEFRRVLRRQRMGWVWHRGHLTDPRSGQDLPYLHFSDWQRTMVRCDVSDPEHVLRFEITAHGVINAEHASGAS